MVGNGVSIQTSIGKLCTTRSVSTAVARCNPRCSFHLLNKNPSQRAETDSIGGRVQKEAGIVFGPYDGIYYIHRR